MIEGLIGYLILIGIIAIVLWAIFEILKQVGFSIPPVARIVVIAVIGIVLLLLLAQVLGITIPSLQGATG